METISRFYAGYYPKEYQRLRSRDGLRNPVKSREVAKTYPGDLSVRGLLRGGCRRVRAERHR